MTSRLARYVSAVIGALLLAQGAGAADNQKIWAGLFSYQQKMAHLGNAEAQHKLADMYDQGLGADADPVQARHWYEAAAAQGYAPAQQRLEQLDDETKHRAAAPTETVQRAPAAPVTPPAAPAAAATELDQLQRERERLAQELAQSREAVKMMQEQQALQARQKDEALRRAEADKKEALRRLAARERLEAERRKLLAVPGGYDN